MQLTLHVTNQCNITCKYCFVERGPQRMSLEVAKAAAELAMAGADTTGLLFYGGEPLLERQLIYDTVAHTQLIRKETGHNFHYKMTTNGILLDEEFLKFAQRANLAIAFSHDGPAQDDCRLFHDGAGTAAALDEKIPLLLKYQPYAVAMSVIDPSTVHKTAKIVKFLYRRGFRYITANLNYDHAVSWTPEHFATLASEYEKLAKMYIRLTNAEEKIYISPIDAKILSHLKGEKYHLDRKLMAKNQPSVAPDGKIYLGSRHLNQPEFQIGDVFSGLDFEKQDALIEMGVPPAPCRECAILSRCNYAYGTIRLAHDKSEPVSDTNRFKFAPSGEFTHDISPAQCAHEQLITPIADRTAVALQNSAMFLHKHYNEMYPVISLIEEMNL